MNPLQYNLNIVKLFSLFRCSSSGSRKAFYPEVTTMLCTFWLCFWSTKWPKVEGSKTSSFKWNGRIYHTQSQCDYGTYLPWSSTYGKWFNNENFLFYDSVLLLQLYQFILRNFEEIFRKDQLCLHICKRIIGLWNFIATVDFSFFL